MIHLYFLLEEKQFKSPSGRHLNFLLALFNSHTSIQILPEATSDAISEGLVSKIFQVSHLPAKMILSDRDKIRMFMENGPY
jgi:hypothetical protein